MSDERLRGDLPVMGADAAADAVGDDATLLVSGFGSVGYPKAVPLALAESGRDLALTVVSGGSVGSEIDVALVEADAIARRVPYQSHPPARAAVNGGEIAFQDRHVSGLGDEVRYGALVEDPCTAVVEAVAVGEDWLVPSGSIGQTPAFVERADRLLVEVNDAQPRKLERMHDIYRPDAPPKRDPIPLSAADERIGDSHVGFDPAKLEAVVRTDRRDDAYAFREPTATDRAVADRLVGFLDGEIDRSPILSEHVHLQFGVGSLGNALMGALVDANLDSELVYFGEVIQDGLLDMLDAGKLAGASATALALSADGQDRLFEEIDRYAEDIVLRPADVSNAPALIDRFGVVGINSALEVDLYGHANSTHVNGSRLINGLGGSNDFTRHAAVSVIALPSTTADGERSRIVPMAPHVDHTEHDVDIVITDRGVADLRGLAPRGRARAMIECAHPEYRDRLAEYVERAERDGGNIPHDLEGAVSWHRE